MSINTDLNFINDSEVGLLVKNLKECNSQDQLSAEQQQQARRVSFTTNDMQRILRLVVIENGKTTYRAPNYTEDRKDDTTKTATKVHELLQDIELYKETRKKYNEFQAARRETLTALSNEKKQSSTDLARIIGTILVITALIWYKS